MTYKTLIIGEHRVDDRGRFELLGPDSLADFVPAVTPGLGEDDVLCEDGVTLKIPGSLHVSCPPPDFICSLQVTAAHCMIKTYLPQIGDRALLVKEAHRRGLRVVMPSEARKPSPRAGCRCPIRNLMSTGHDAGCPEAS